jgi:hypothetical protein
VLERFERSLRIISLGLGVLLVFEILRMGIRRDPLARLEIPEIPTLESEGTRTLAVATTAAVSVPVTGVSAPVGSKGTNAAAMSTNSTNATVVSGGTNRAGGVPPGGGTNKPVVKSGAAPEGPAGMMPGMPAGMMPAGMMPGMMGMPFGGGPGGPGMGGPKLTPLSAQIQGRIDKVVQSEAFAPIMRPLPMALLGIAGQQAILRAPNGQTDLVKEGAELGGLKLLRIGINRVLVEHEGQPKELTIFNGFGSESLLPKQKEIVK